MKKYTALVLCLALLAVLLSGCGAASKTEQMALPMEAPAAMEEMENDAMLSESGAGQTGVLPESRKWIITVRLSAETEDLDALLGALEEKIAEMKGYVEDQSVYNGSSRANRRYRQANMTVRIPADQVDQFTEQVSGMANVVDKQKTLEDITLQYVSTESRVKALETEEARLLELMAQAETMADLLEIEGRLTDVRYELESFASQLRIYDNQIDYATVHLSLNEVQEYTPVEEPSLWERIAGGFGDSIEGLGESLQDLLVFTVTAAPFLVVYGGLVLVLAVLVKKLWKRPRRARKEPEKKEEA